MELQVNGKNYTVKPKAGENLLDILRNNLELTGSKYGCGEGQCGACTVLLNSIPVRSCIMPVTSATGKEIITIEGLAKEGVLHPLQKAFLKVDACQCSYCASGMIMSAAGLLRRNPKPTDREIVKAMNGNICRCGTYPRIMEAIREAANS